MRIGELAGRSGVSVRALRYYEEQGLLVPRRTSGGQRCYEPAALDRVHLIQQLYAAGLASRTVADILPCVDAGLATPALLERLVTERDRIEGQLLRLAAARDRLDGVIEAARHPEQPCEYTSRAVAGS